MKKKIRLPFRVSRESRKPLVVQMTDGLRRSIEAGYYAPGMTLPTLEELTEASGTSVIIARGAIRRLMDEGYVISRPRIGTVVLDRSARKWKGCVLIVGWEPAENFYLGNINAVIRANLMRRGFLPLSVPVVGQDGRKTDFGPLDAMLSQPLRLAFVSWDQGGVGQHVAEAGVPFVTMSQRSHPRAGSSGCVYVGYDGAISDFAAECVRKRIRKVIEVAFDSDGRNRVAPAFAGLGVDVEVWHPPEMRGRHVNENIGQGTVLAFEDRFRHEGRAWLPDVFYFNDDFAAAGALASLQNHGVRIPEDVGFVTSVNGGSGPFFCKPLTRVELDPFQIGEQVSDYLLNVLEGRKTDPVLQLQAMYIRGKTF